MHHPWVVMVAVWLVGLFWFCPVCSFLHEGHAEVLFLWVKRWKQVSLHLSLYLVSLFREEEGKHVLREMKRSFPLWRHCSIKLEVFQEGCFCARLLLAPQRNESFGRWPARWRTFRFQVQVRIKEIRRSGPSQNLDCSSPCSQCRLGL